MIRKTKKNIILALWATGVLIAIALYQRQTGSSVPAEIFYLAAAGLFLSRCKVGGKQCGA